MRGFQFSRSVLLVASLLVGDNALGQSDIRRAPGAPGADAKWASAGKQAVGTANRLESQVWFTLQSGALTEVFFPIADMANVHLLEFVVVNPVTRRVETERENATHAVQVLNQYSLSFRQINTAANGAWKIVKTYTTDPKRNTVLIDVQFETKDKVWRCTSISIRH